MICRYSWLVPVCRRGTASAASTVSTNLRRRKLVSLTITGGTPTTAATSTDHYVGRVGPRQANAFLSSAAVMDRKLVPDVTEERRQVQLREQRLKTPPAQEDSGPAIQEMRAKLRTDKENGSRGSRRVRRDGKIPGVVYSNNDSSFKGSRGEPLCVKVDKLIVDREIRRLQASFDNTVYNLVIEGALPVEDDEVTITVGDPSVDSVGKQDGGSLATAEEEAAVTGGESGVTPASDDGPKELRELVLANECRLHPVLRTVLSVNWMRYKAGRKYPIPIKFINSDLNDSFKKGAYIRRLKTHQHIHLPDNPEKVPRWLYLDLEFVQSGSKLRVSDIIIPDGIRFFRGNESDMWNEIVCTIKGRKMLSYSGGTDEENEDKE